MEDFQYCGETTSTMDDSADFDIPQYCTVVLQDDDSCCEDIQGGDVSYPPATTFDGESAYHKLEVICFVVYFGGTCLG